MAQISKHILEGLTLEQLAGLIKEAITLMQERIESGQDSGIVITDAHLAQLDKIKADMESGKEDWIDYTDFMSDWDNYAA